MYLSSLCLFTTYADVHPSPRSSVARQWTVDILHVCILYMYIYCSSIERHVKANFRKLTLCFSSSLLLYEDSLCPKFILKKTISCRTVTRCSVAGILIDVPAMLQRATTARSNAVKTRVEKLAVARVRQEYRIRCVWTLWFWLAACRGTTFRLSGK